MQGCCNAVSVHSGRQDNLNSAGRRLDSRKVLPTCCESGYIPRTLTVRRREKAQPAPAAPAGEAEHEYHHSDHAIEAPHGPPIPNQTAGRAQPKVAPPQISPLLRMRAGDVRGWADWTTQRGEGVFVVGGSWMGVFIGGGDLRCGRKGKKREMGIGDQSIGSGQEEKGGKHHLFVGKGGFTPCGKQNVELLPNVSLFPFSIDPVFPSNICSLVNSFPAEATQGNPLSLVPRARFAQYRGRDPRPLGPRLLGVRHYLVSEG